MNIRVMGIIIGTANQQEWIDSDGAVFQCEDFVPWSEVTQAIKADTIAFNLETGRWATYNEGEVVQEGIIFEQLA